MKKLLFIAFAISFYLQSNAQIKLPDLATTDSVFIKLHWGDLSVEGTAYSEGIMDATITNTSKIPRKIKKELIDQYIHITKKGKKLMINCRPPKGFESIDLRLQLPQNIMTQVVLLRGGNIEMNNLKNGVEIDQRNGSVVLKNMGNYALVNAANGSIDAAFTTLNATNPVSLITMNGGITVSLPGMSRRDVRLISRKNGYVRSDFKLVTKTFIRNLNIEKYAKEPISANAKINGGGALLFLSTENGPIAIKRSR